MRKKERETTREEAWKIFDESPYCSVSMMDGDYPYTIMVNAARIEETIYFHCALEGKKLACIKEHPQVCISAVSKHTILSQKQTTAYASCILKATAECIEDMEEKRRALHAICERFTPDHMDCIDHIQENGIRQTGIVRMKVSEITGKQNLFPK